MAYRLASKINRFLSPNKFSIPSSERLQSTLTKNPNSADPKPKVKYVQYKVRSIKSFTHGTQPGRCTYKDKNVPFPVKTSASHGATTSKNATSASVAAENPDFVQVNLSNVQKEQATAVVTPLIEKNDSENAPGLISSNRSQYPDEYEPSPPKRFERSNTQNAITGPLKLPRLASPFPDPVKIMMSHETLSDKEKADMMFEEVKMEQRFKDQYEQEQREKEKYKAAEREMRSNGHQSRRNAMEKRNFSSLSNIFPANVPTQVEQCEKIINELRGQVPDKEIPRKPLLNLDPGSEQEKQFVKNTMKFLARHNKKLAKKTKAAPFPSYSEVKTFAREAKITGVKTDEKINSTANAKIQLTELRSPELMEVDLNKVSTSKKPGAAIGTTQFKNSIQNGNISLALPLAMRRKYASAATLQHLLGVRFYSEEYNSICDLNQKTPMPECPRLVMKGCKRPNPKGCHRRAPIPPCRKQVAPYPSYSECMDPVYADDPTECTQCPWPGEVSYEKVDGKALKKRRYSTTARVPALDNVSLKASRQSFSNQFGSRNYHRTENCDPDYCADPQPPKQCKRPRQNRPPCDYKGTAAKRTDRRIRKLHKPPKKYRYSTSAPNNGHNESADVISKVREWLNAWRPDHENIRITARRRSPTNADANAPEQEVTRESYEIEIVEKRPDVAMASAAFHPGEAIQTEHGAPAGDLPAFVSEVAGMSQDGRPVVKIIQNSFKPRTPHLAINRHLANYSRNKSPVNKVKKSCYKVPKQEPSPCITPPEVRYRPEVRKRPLPKCPPIPKCPKWGFEGDVPKVELTRPVIEKIDVERPSYRYDPSNVIDPPPNPSFIKVDESLKPTLVYKPYKPLKKSKSANAVPNPVLKEIKVEEEVRKDGQTKPMTLKFSFWHKGAKTHSLYDKKRDIKNKEVLTKVQKTLENSDNKEIVEKKLPEELKESLNYVEKKRIGLKTNYWSKASKTVFLNKLDKALDEPYIAKDFSSAKVLRKGDDEEQPMKLKDQFKSNAKTVFLGKIM